MTQQYHKSGNYHSTLLAPLIGMASTNMEASGDSDNVSDSNTVIVPSRTVLSRQSNPTLAQAQANTLSIESAMLLGDYRRATSEKSDQAGPTEPSTVLLPAENKWLPYLYASKTRLPPVQDRYKRPGYLIRRPQSPARSSLLQVPKTTLPSEFEGADTTRTASTRTSHGPLVAPPVWRDERKSRREPSRFEEFVAGCKRLGGRRARSNSLSQTPSQMSHGYQISLATIFPSNDQPIAGSEVEGLYNSAVMDSVLDEINAIQSTIADRERTMSRIQGTAKEIQTAYKLDRQIYKVCSVSGE